MATTLRYGKKNSQGQNSRGRMARVGWNLTKKDLRFILADLEHTIEEANNHLSRERRLDDVKRLRNYLRVWA